MKRRDFNIEFSIACGCLRAFVTGRNGTLENALAYWRAIAAEFHRVRPRLLLVMDVMDGGMPPPEQMLAFIQAMEGENLQGTRIAYVEDKYEVLPKAELVGIFALERGYEVQVFNDEECAERWLRYGNG